MYRGEEKTLVPTMPSAADAFLNLAHSSAEAGRAPTNGCDRLANKPMATSRLIPIATSHEPTPSRLTSLKSTHFGLTAKTSARGPLSWAAQNSYSSINQSPTPAGASPSMNSPLPDSA